MARVWRPPKGHAKGKQEQVIDRGEGLHRSGSIIVETAISRFKIHFGLIDACYIGAGAEDIRLLCVGRRCKSTLPKPNREDKLAPTVGHR